jgi:hypothetical protein
MVTLSLESHQWCNGYLALESHQWCNGYLAHQRLKLVFANRRKHFFELFHNLTKMSVIAYKTILHFEFTVVIYKR